MIESNDQFLVYYLILNTCYFFGMLGLHLLGRSRLIFGAGLTALLSFCYSIRTAGVGSDAGNYILLIADKNPLVQEMSPFIVYLGKLVHILSGDEVMLFFIVSFITNMTILFAFYKIDRKNYLVLMAVFSVSFLFINSNMNVLRQGMAISVGFWAIYYIVNYHFTRYAVAVVLATLIHSSAVILFILPVILWVQKKRTVYLCVFILAILYLATASAVTILYYLQDIHWSFARLYWYLTWENIKQFNLKHVYYLYLVIIAIYLYLYESLSIELRRYSLVFLSILVLMVLFRSDDFIVDRFSFYFIPVAVILYVNLYKVLKVNRNNLYKTLFIFLPFMWLGKSAYQFNLWWILGIVR